MTENLFQIFDMYREAVLIAEDDTVVYANRAAELLFGRDVKKTELYDIFPAHLLMGNEYPLTGSAEINGTTYSVSITEDECHKIFSIFSNAGGIDENTANVIDSISSAMRDQLGVLNVSSRIITPAIENINDKKLNYSLAALQHTYHSLARLASNMKIFSALYNCTKPFNTQTFDIVNLCKEMVEFISYSMKNRNVKIEVISSADKILYRGDGDKIAQMILNVLSNSLKYLGDDGVISIKIKEQKKKVVIAIHDNGAGLKTAEMSSVFNNYREPKKFTDPQSGVGIGLSVVQNIAKMHGGSAVLESKPKRGTTVTIVLPHNEEYSLFERDREVDPDYLTNLSDVLPTEAYYTKYLD